MDSPDRLTRHLLIGFATALVIYAVFFAVDYWTRTRKGPWIVSFRTNNKGFVEIVIDQPFLRISNVHIAFSNEHATNPNAVIQFDSPLKQIPFGTNKFEDLTYLPGSVAFDFFGHEVELLPRTLYLNKREVPWNSGTNIILRPEQKLSREMTFDPRERKRRRN